MAGRFGMGRVVCRVWFWFWFWFLRVGGVLGLWEGGGGGGGLVYYCKSVDLASIVFPGGARELGPGRAKVSVRQTDGKIFQRLKNGTLSCRYIARYSFSHHTCRELITSSRRPNIQNTSEQTTPSTRHNTPSTNPH